MPAIGQQAPDFELLNQEGQLLRLSDLRGQRVILVRVSQSRHVRLHHPGLRLP